MKPKNRSKPPAKKPVVLADADLPATITSAVFESLAGLSSRRLRQLAEAGKFPPPKSCRWETAPCLKGLIAHLRSGADELRKARLEKLRSETRLLDLTHAEREGHLLDFDDAVQVLTRGLGAMTSTVMAMDLPIDRREEVITKLREAGTMFGAQLNREIANENKSQTASRSTSGDEAKPTLTIREG